MNESGDHAQEIKVRIEMASSNFNFWHVDLLFICILKISWRERVTNEAKEKSVAYEHR